MLLRPFFQRLYSDVRLSCGAGVAFFLFSIVILINLTFFIRDVRDTAIPLALILPDLERRLDILTEQVELAELHSALQGGSAREFVHAYVLPGDADLHRILGFFDLLRDVLVDRGSMHNLSSVQFEESYTEGDVYLQPFSVTMEISGDGIHRVGTILDIAGWLTIGDALTNEDRARLFDFSEEENPASVVALEQFLSTDLLRYAQDPKSYEEQVNRSFVSPLFEREFSHILQKSVFRDIRESLGGELGLRLSERRLWPLRFMTVESALIEKIKEDYFRLKLILVAYSRVE